MAAKRNRADGQLTKEQYFSAEASPLPQGPFAVAGSETLAARRFVRARRAETVLNAEMYTASMSALNRSFAAWVDAQLAADPNAPVIEAARDYLSYSRACEARRRLDDFLLLLLLPQTLTSRPTSRVRSLHRPALEICIFSMTNDR